MDRRLVLAERQASGMMAIEAFYVFEMCGREIIFTEAPRWAPKCSDEHLREVILALIR
jgi:hypothetical protein